MASPFHRPLATPGADPRSAFSSSSSSRSPLALGPPQSATTSPAPSPPPSALAADSVRPLRPMLARGAACDTCRARKVKCDAARPHCSPCLKSARGDLAVAGAKCTYEGTSVAAAREAALAAREAAASAVGGRGGSHPGGPGAKRKRKSTPADAATSSPGGPPAINGDDDDPHKRGRFDSRPDSAPSAADYPPLPLWMQQQHHHQQQQQQPQQQLPGLHHHSAPAYAPASEPALPVPSLAYPPPPPHPASYATGEYTMSSAPESTPATAPMPAPPPPPSHDRVQDLQGRILELERALQAATSAPSASTTTHPPPHTRSPSFPYATYLPPPAGPGPTGPASIGSYSNGIAAGPPNGAYGMGGLGGAPATNPYGWTGGPHAAVGGESPSIGGMGAASFLAAAAAVAAAGERPGGARPGGPTASSSSLDQLPPIMGGLAGGGAGGGSPRGLNGFGLNRGDPSRRSWSAWNAAARAGDDGFFGGGGGSNSGGSGGGPGGMTSWAAASPLSSLRGTSAAGGAGYDGAGAELFPLGASPRAMVSSLRGTAGPGIIHPTTATPITTSTAGVAATPGDSRSGSLSGPSAAGSSTCGTTPAAGVSPSTSTPEAGVGNKPTSANAATSTHTTTMGGAPDVDVDAAAAATTTYELDEFALTPELYALLHPAYPPSLPPISTLHHLVSTFFTRAAVPATMLGRAGILTSLAYGPADPRWPDEALMHAICAYGTLYVSPASLSPPTEGTAPALGLELDQGFGAAPRGLGRRTAYWEREGDKTPREYHYRCARRSIERSLLSGESGGVRRKMLQVVQATILICYVAYQRSQFTDLWILAGLVTRLCTPLGLNHLDPWDFATGRCGPEKEDWGVRVRFVERQDLLDAPTTVEEHWERATTWWMAFAVDRFASASTDWSTSIDEKDITTHLPCISPQPLPCLEIDPATGLIPSLSITSPICLEDTSAPIGSVGLYVKATVLLGRVINHLQRLPRTKCVKQGAACSAVKAAAKTRPEFIEIDIALSKFKESVGPRLYDAVADGVDGFLVSAYCIPHVATILLHEGFTDRYDRGPTSSLARCLTAAKCVVNAIHVLHGLTYDLAGGDPWQPFGWSVTGRALVRDYATRRLWGQVAEAETARGLAESCLQFYERCDHSIGGCNIAGTLAQTLRGHLENPDKLLPLDGSGVDA